MRGLQMAASHLDWEAKPLATVSDMRRFDAVVLVKRVPKDLLQDIKKWGGPLIYDPLDFWKQPYESQGIHSVTDIHNRFFNHFDSVGADLVLATNEVMKKDLEGMCQRAEVLPHHFDPFLKVPRHVLPNTLVYWGHQRYLAEWTIVVQEYCRAKGYTFRINPPNPYLAAAMFAVRGGLYGSWLDRRWKSGIKGVTALALGIPFVARPEESYREQCADVLYEFEDEFELSEILDEVLGNSIRFKPCMNYSLTKISNQLETLLQTL